LVFGQARLEIVAILNSWRAPAGKFFQVQTLSNQSFELFYSEFSDQWSVKTI